MIYLTRRETFNAAHRLYNNHWSEEQNDTIFGKCANKNWHGHNYELFVTVKGEINPDTGFVVNLKDLSTLIRTDVTEILDHKNLNLDVDFMKGKLASCENLIAEIWKILQPGVANISKYGTLHGIRLYETPRNYVEYFGE